MSTQLPTDSDLRDYAESRGAIIVSSSQNTSKHLHLRTKVPTSHSVTQGTDSTGWTSTLTSIHPLSQSGAHDVGRNWRTWNDE